MRKGKFLTICKNVTHTLVVMTCQPLLSTLVLFILIASVAADSFTHGLEITLAVVGSLMAVAIVGGIAIFFFLQKRKQRQQVSYSF